MYLEILKYEVFKDVVNNLNENIKNNIKYDESILFNLANFNTISNYFKLLSFKGKKYDLNNKIMNNFDEFFIDLLINIDKENDFDRLLFIYGFLTSYMVDKEMESYIYALNIDKPIDEIKNMIDLYYAKENDLDIINNKLTNLFKDGFKYEEYIENTIHFTLIKHFMLMSSNELYLKYYKYKKKFYSHYNKKNLHYLFYKIKHLFTKNKYKSNELFYKNNIDESILNKDKNEYRINNISYDYNLDKYVDNIKYEISRKINIINDYLIDNNDKKLIKEFNLSKDKKI